MTVHSAQGSEGKPIVFSIITVVFNGEALLPGTVESVMQQTYPHLEYIVIDGASTDHSIRILEEFAATIPYLQWITEKDSGIYDAMNKGLRKATGDFVLFLNCGDRLHSPDTIEKLAALVTPQTDVLYGETLLVDGFGHPAGTMSQLGTRTLPLQLDWHAYRGGMLVVHQSFIARRTLSPFYIAHNLCADYDWCIQILKLSRENIHTGFIITDYLMGGQSKQRHWQSLQDRFAVMRVHFGLVQTVAAHIWIVIRALRHRFYRIGQPTY